MNLKTLIIFEGNRAEYIFYNVIKHFFPEEVTHDLTYLGINILSLKKFIEEEYPNFLEEDINLQLLVSDYKQSCGNKDEVGLLDDEYEQIILIVDLDPQTKPDPKSEDFKIIKYMQSQLVDRYGSGLMLIEYPQHEAYKWDDSPINEVIITHKECFCFKDSIMEHTSIKSKNKLTESTIKLISNSHVSKFSHLTSLSEQEIFEDRLEHLLETQISSLLSEGHIHLICTSFLFWDELLNWC